MVPISQETKVRLPGQSSLAQKKKRIDAPVVGEELQNSKYGWYFSATVETKRPSSGAPGWEAGGIREPRDHHQQPIKLSAYLQPSFVSSPLGRRSRLERRIVGSTNRGHFPRHQLPGDLLALSQTSKSLNVDFEEALQNPHR
ncbi:hypothetical protein MC885_020345 [Smutsia gigantea]|nr:hypothetical protein MC885_020345 [Smutsia gigantea]